MVTSWAVTHLASSVRSPSASVGNASPALRHAAAVAHGGQGFLGYGCEEDTVRGGAGEIVLGKAELGCGIHGAHLGGCGQRKTAGKGEQRQKGGSMFEFHERCYLLELSSEVVFAETRSLFQFFYAALRGRIYRALASGAGRMWMPETMPMAMNMVNTDVPP